MADFLLPLIKGVVAAMKADSAVGAVIGDRVYTDVPQKETFPYSVVFPTAADWSAKDFSGQEIDLQISTFSRDKTPKESLDACKACYDLFHRQESAITLDSGTIANIQYTSSQSFKDPDGVTWQGVINFRVVIS